VDPAANLILRALGGETGQFEIGGRNYQVTCAPVFRLKDEVSGQVHNCTDTASLLRTIQHLRVSLPFDAASASRVS